MGGSSRESKTLVQKTRNMMSSTNHMEQLVVARAWDVWEALGWVKDVTYSWRCRSWGPVQKVLKAVFSRLDSTQ